jgi:hypothetical protein
MYSFGTVLLYRLDTWHRGAEVNPGKTRFVMNLLWKKKDAHRIGYWNRGWAVSMYYLDYRLERLIATSSIK